MALEEVSFYNTNGDEITLSNIVDQMINYYKLKHEVGETELTDFNEGSEIRNLLEAFAVAEYARMEEENENTKIAFISTSYGGWLDKIGELPFINLERETGNEATGIVKFTLATARNEDYTIPAETMLESSSTELAFLTSADATIFAGETTCDCVAEALGIGSDGNVASGSIDTITDVDIDTELVSVTNESPFTGGRDFEEDDDYRERLLANVQQEGFGSIGYYQRLGSDVPGVHDVKLVDDPSYTKKVLVNGDVKETPSTVLLDVLAVFSDVHNLVLGHSFIVDKPTYDEIELEIGLDVSTALDEDVLSEVLQVFFDGGDAPNFTSYSGLNIDEVVSRDRLVSVFTTYADVVDVTSVMVDDEEVSELSPSVNGVLQLSSVSFNQNVVG